MQSGDIISYMDMIHEENIPLQRGMNFRLKPTYSVILMSVRAGAPYQDQISDDGTTIMYEWHDVNNGAGVDPKMEDQPYRHKGGTLTQNWLFFEAAEKYKKWLAKPELVKVYEKIKNGIRSFAWYFSLVDASQILDGNNRSVFKFTLRIIGDIPMWNPGLESELEHSRIIPTAIKLAVWKRDWGKCVTCWAASNLHFDHIIPYAKGGTSLETSNIQLLCMRHNLQKRDHII